MWWNFETKGTTYNQLFVLGYPVGSQYIQTKGNGSLWKPFVASFVQSMSYGVHF